MSRIVLKDRRKIIHLTVLCLFAIAMIFCTDVVYGIEEENISNRTLIGLAIDVFCIVVCGLMYITIAMDSRVSKTTDILLAIVGVEGLLLVCDIISWSSEGHSNLSAQYNLSCLGMFAFAMLISVMFWHYQIEEVGRNRRAISSLTAIVVVIMILGLALILTNPLTEFVFSIDDTGHYHRETLWLLFNVLPVIVLVLAAGISLTYARTFRERLASATYLVIPISAIVVQNIYYGVSILYSSLVFVIIVIYGNFYVSRGEELAKKDAELMNERFMAMFSQIQPHFLYNSLTSIMNIKGNPPETKEAIAEFGVYLRGNLNTVDCCEPIPISKELDQVETYVHLEKLRFKERLTVVWLINDRRFAIPALTLQMVVENAIKHGVTQKIEGGTVRIITECTEGGHLLKVIDDGVGFIPSKACPKDGKTHVGLMIVKSRVEEMTGGTVTVKSALGKGTTVTIFIPEKE